MWEAFNIKSLSFSLTFCNFVKFFMLKKAKQQMFEKFSKLLDFNAPNETIYLSFYFLIKFRKYLLIASLRLQIITCNLPSLAKIVKDGRGVINILINLYPRFLHINLKLFVRFLFKKRFSFQV